MSAAGDIFSCLATFAPRSLTDASTDFIEVDIALTLPAMVFS